MRAKFGQQLRHRRGRIARRALLIVGLALIPLVLSIAKPAAAANPWATCKASFNLGGDPPSQIIFPTDQTVTCTWAPANNPGLFVVPDGVTSIHVSLVGAGGQTGHTGHYCDDFNFQGDGSHGGSGGAPAQVSGTLSVTPGEFLSVMAGSTGSHPFHGGSGGGGAVLKTGSCPDYGGSGGDGGGASFIANVNDPNNPSYLAIAAGGGGGGGGTDQPDCGPGAVGGAAGQKGGDMIEFPCAVVSTNGGGGSPGVNNDGNGGAGGNSSTIFTTGGGGGGGGGLKGGGGGAAGNVWGGAGGGGATSFTPLGGTASTCTSSCSPAVVVTYTDTTAPTTSISLSGTSPNHNGWYTSSVGIGTSATDPDDEDGAFFDPISSIFPSPATWETRCALDPAAVPTNFFFLPNVICTNPTATSEGQHTAYAASEDLTGNLEQMRSVSFGIDETAPVTSIALGPSAPDGSNGWYRSPVVVGASPLDPGGSGVASTRCVVDPASAPANFNALPAAECSWPTTVSSDGQHAAYAASQDVAGNKEALSGGPRTFKIDSTAPYNSPLLSGTPGSNGWWTTDVALIWNWGDATSGIDSNTCTSGGTTSGEGTALTVNGSCKDLAGNMASDSKTFKVDKTPPTISVAAVPASPTGSNGWYTSNVTAHFTCGDNLSGVVSCPADQTLSTEGSSVSSTAQTVNDNAGLTSVSSGTITVKIDKTAPTVGVTGVTDGAQYTYGNVPAAGCSTTDGVSGVATAATVSITGGQNGAGSFTATCSGAVDKAGNQAAPVSVSYTVLFAFGGFVTPRPGGTVPYKPGTTTQVSFTLRDAQGQAISAAILSTLSGKLTAKLSGQGITPTTAACNWSQLLTRFQCSLPIPTLLLVGSVYPYQVTVYENLTGTPVPAPPFTNNPLDVNPATVYFG